MDDSAIPIPCMRGLGGVFRKSDGQWLLEYYGKIPYTTNLTAEVLAIKEGLELELQRGFTNLIVESDSMVALSILENNDNEKLKYLVCDCRYFMQKLGYVKLQHSFREAYKLAQSSRQGEELQLISSNTNTVASDINPSDSSKFR